MKKVTGIIIIFILTLLVACKPGEPLLRMDTPRGLIVEKNILTFNEVSDATGYIINANGVNTETSETKYTFEKPGLYRVKIKAIGENRLDSLFSEEVIVDVKYLEYPTDIDVVNHLITFTYIEGADYYNIEIDGEIYNSSIDIIGYLEPGNYKIRVQSISRKYINSEFSPLTVYEVKKDDSVVTTNNYSYSSNTNFDLLLFCYSCIDLSVSTYELEILTLDDKDVIVNKEKVGKDNLYILENAVYIQEEFLRKLIEMAAERKEDQAHLLLTTNLGEHNITIKFVNTMAPYVYSDKQVTTNFHHVAEFRFDTFKAKFVDLTGHEITKDDYTYNDGNLQIKPEFILKAFEKSEGAKELIFTYRFEREKDTFLGFIKIIR